LGPDKLRPSCGILDAMSKESTTPDLVERVRGILGAANRQDWDSILALYAPDAVWDMSERGVGTYQGAQAIRGFWEDWWSSYEHLQIDVLEVVDIGNGVILAAFDLKGPPKGTTVEISTRMVLLYEWTDGDVSRITAYFDLDEGRAAAERLAEERG
jgi:ketosteroid isomerase-like protein